MRCKRTTDLDRSHLHAEDRALVDLYILAMRRRNLAEATVAMRERRMELLGMHHRIAEVTAEDIEVFLDERIDIGPRTRYTWISHFNCFYTWAVAQEHLDRNPVAKLQRPRLGRLLPRPTPRDEVDLALEKAPTAILRAWITLAAYAGLRCVEIATLQGEDIDFDAGTLRVMGKGTKPRVVPMHPRVRAVLTDAPSSGPVFVDQIFALPFHPSQVSKLGGDYMRSIGLRASQMHRLRHRFATALLTEGADITIVADLLGHENLNNTRGYAMVSNSRMRNAVNLLD